MNVTTQIKAGAVRVNHNETLLLRSAVKAGFLNGNHNEAQRS